MTGGGCVFGGVLPGGELVDQRLPHHRRAAPRPDRPPHPIPNLLPSPHHPSPLRLVSSGGGLQQAVEVRDRAAEVVTVDPEPKPCPTPTTLLRLVERSAQSGKSLLKENNEQDPAGKDGAGYRRPQRSRRRCWPPAPRATGCPCRCRRATAVAPRPADGSAPPPAHACQPPPAVIIVLRLFEATQPRVQRIVCAYARVMGDHCSTQASRKCP